MNWYKKAGNPDADIYGWPDMESYHPHDPKMGLYEDWLKKGKKLQGMAAKAQEMMDLALKAMEEDDIEKFKMYDSLVEDWREEHSERVRIYDGGQYFIVNLFEDGSMW